MKVYFLETVRGLGQKGEIKELKDGHANYLIKNKLAISYNHKSKNSIDAAIAEEAKNLALATLEANKNKELLERQIYTFERKLTPKGTIDRQVSKKEFVSYIAEKYNINLDPRKIDLPEITSLNTSYIVKVSLGYGVKAELTIKLVEEKK